MLRTKMLWLKDINSGITRTVIDWLDIFQEGKSLTDADKTLTAKLRAKELIPVEWSGYLQRWIPENA